MTRPRLALLAVLLLAASLAHEMRCLRPPSNDFILYMDPSRS